MHGPLSRPVLAHERVGQAGLRTRLATHARMREVKSLRHQHQRVRVRTARREGDPDRRHRIRLREARRRVAGRARVARRRAHVRCERGASFLEESVVRMQRRLSVAILDAQIDLVIKLCARPEHALCERQQLRVASDGVEDRRPRSVESERLSVPEYERILVRLHIGRAANQDRVAVIRMSDGELVRDLDQARQRGGIERALHVHVAVLFECGL